MLVNSVPLSLAIVLGRTRVGDVRIHLLDDAQARQRGLGDERQALPTEVVHHSQGPEAAAIGEGVPY